MQDEDTEDFEPLPPTSMPSVSFAMRSFADELEAERLLARRNGWRRG